MNTSSIKTLLGSTLNKVKEGRLTGKMCMLNLQLMNIINGLIEECNTLCPTEDEINKLKKLYRDLQNITPYICKIRNRPQNHFFELKVQNINNFFKGMATFDLNINGEVNQPPSEVGNGSITTDHATTHVFVRSDFTTNTVPPYSDPEGDAAELLRVLSLPAGGQLSLNGIPVILNQVIDFADIDFGLFTYEPDPGNTVARVETFSFAIADAGSLIFVS